MQIKNFGILVGSGDDLVSAVKKAKENAADTIKENIVSSLYGDIK